MDRVQLFSAPMSSSAPPLLSVYVCCDKRNSQVVTFLLNYRLQRSLLVKNFIYVNRLIHGPTIDVCELKNISIKIFTARFSGAKKSPVIGREKIILWSWVTSNTLPPFIVHCSVQFPSVDFIWSEEEVFRFFTRNALRIWKWTSIKWKLKNIVKRTKTIRRKIFF